MRCPYCVSEIPDEAAVCSHCRRDLLLVKSLLLRVTQLEAELANRSQIAGNEAGQPAATESVNAPDAESMALTQRSYLATLAWTMLPVIVILVAAQVLLLFVYNANPLYLRYASMLIPVPAGFAAALAHPRRLALSTAGGFVLALVAVFIMLSITAKIDGVPVLPEEFREVREVLEYVASIGLAFLTGLLLGNLRQRQAAGRPSRVMIYIVHLFRRDDGGTIGLERVAKRVQQQLSQLAPLVTAAASIYTGIKALMSG